MTEPTDQTQLVVEDVDGVRRITWNRPDTLNAMSIEMWHGTRDALDSAEADGVRCIVLTGAGSAFCVGQDLSEFADPRHAEPDGGFRGLMRALAEVDVPLVAAVNGTAVGFGFTVLPWCDLVLVSPSARFKAPFVGLGVTTEAAASVALPEVLGPQVANWHLLTGEWLTAEDAVRHGLALRLVDPDELVPEAMTIARRLADQPPIALRTTVGLIRERRRAGWDAAVAREYEAMAQLAGGEENIAAITRFFERS
jgi:enoyl-CoA hydratase/carnithine racemase